MKQDIALEILKTGRNVFLTGSAGTGKTYILNKYIQYLKEHGIWPSIVAPTGIAASYIGGTTIHSFFGIGIKEFLTDYEIDLMTQKEYLYNRFKNLKILIIDEVSMVAPSLFELMDKILRAFKLADVPFGGVQIVLSGDFFQLPPISKQAREIKFACQTALWKESDLKVCYMEKKFRQKDNTLVKILDEIRENNVSEESMEVFKSCHH
jgi:Cdc6-like AAA superfamily ATPase